jgi:CO/xanthine dehydrogenase FAD-binding subunit
MKPAQFDYVRPSAVREVTEVLASCGGDGKIIAGGQSLMPMINFRLVKPSILVDINGIPELSSIEASGARLRVGATVRHYMTATDPLVRERIPILHEAMHYVAHLTVRNRGTFCGSVCHADPAAEMPMMTLLLNAEIVAVSVRGERRIAAADFYLGSLVNSLEPDEFVTAIEIDTLPTDTGWAFEEFSKRHGDFALACVATTMRKRDGRATDVRFATMGVGETPLRLTPVEALIEGREVTPPLMDEVAELLCDMLSPNTDLHASADYRRHLAGGLAKRALADAWLRAARVAGGA